MAINSALTRRFQYNLLRKLAADTKGIQLPGVLPESVTNPYLAKVKQQLAEATKTPAAPPAEPSTKEKIVSVLKAYSPYVGGGAALGALIGGGIGYGTGKNTVLGSLIGGGAGAALGGGGKYLYDRYGDKLFGKKAAEEEKPAEEPSVWQKVVAKLQGWGNTAKNAVWNDTTKSYAPYVGGAAALGALGGGLLGNQYKQTLLGSILGGVGGAGLGVGGKYLYDKYGAQWIADHFGKGKDKAPEKKEAPKK